MSGLAVNLTGFSALNQRLTKMAREDATKTGQAANRAGAAAAAKAMMAAAPVGPDAEGSIRQRTRKGGKKVEEVHHKIVNSIKVRKVRSRTDGTVENKIVAGTYIASLNEFGSIHNAPNPFMRRAFDASQQTIMDAIAKTLDKRLTKKGI
jgi:HK97 gp10 family phage protein